MPSLRRLCFIRFRAGSAGNIVNNTGVLVNLNNITPVFFVSGFTANALTFDSNVPFTLDPGGTYSGALFGIDVASSVLSGLYAGTATLSAEDENGVSFNPSQNIQINIPGGLSLAPEPGSAALALGGLLVSTLGIVRRKRRSLR
ncbi:MAG: hypothetical protein H7Z41_00100 [Cytophagales bacterium]|nr:hypothetical protein [Armatimonadota bacterium]